MPSISVCFSPYQYPLFRNDKAVVVVVDVLRATSAIITGFDNGAKTMIALSGIEETLRYREKGFLIAGERNGEVLPGFDFGNSPFSYNSNMVKNRNIAITTTNGTQAILAANSAYKLYIGSFLNLTTLSHKIIKEKRDTIILCAGWKNKFNLEDTLFAGALIEKLSDKYTYNCDSAIASVELWKIAKTNLNTFLAQSSHRNRLKHLGLQEDIKYCLSLDLCYSVPELKGEILVWNQ